MTFFGIEARYDSVQSTPVFDTDELLARLEAKGVRNVDIARALGLPESRIPEIKKKTRAVKLDEAAKLVRAFSLEQSPEAQPLPAPVLRLAIRYLADRLGTPLTEEQLAELSEDLRAFSEFVADRKVRSSVDAAEGFFRALRLRQSSAPATPRGNDPRPVR